MLHFFRRIRRDLVANSQIFKYLKYAVGEIVLVVLGILIALYINNWNEIRKEHVKFDETLVGVQKELVSNISEVRSILRYFNHVDSVLCRILIDTLSVEEYFNEEKQYDLFKSGFSYGLAVLSNESFKRLKQFNNIDERQDSILQLLENLNLKNKYIVDKIGERMAIAEKENNETLRKYNWFHDWGYGRWDNEEILNYFLGDPEYLNIITSYLITVHDYRRYLEVFDREGLSIYRKIHKYLTSQNLQITDSLLFEYHPEMFKHYLGKYEPGWCSIKNHVHDDSIVISLEENELIYSIYRSDGPDKRIKIIPVDQYHFRTEQGGFYRCSLDDEGEVVSYRFSAGPNFVADMKKVR